MIECVCFLLGIVCGVAWVHLIDDDDTDCFP